MLFITAIYNLLLLIISEMANQGLCDVLKILNVDFNYIAYIFQSAYRVCRARRRMHARCDHDD